MRKKHEGQGAFDWEAVYEHGEVSLHEGNSGSLDLVQPLQQDDPLADHGRQALALFDVLPEERREVAGREAEGAKSAAKPVLREWALGTKSGWQLCGKCTLCLEVKREGKWELR